MSEDMIEGLSGEACEEADGTGCGHFQDTSETRAAWSPGVVSQRVIITQRHECSMRLGCQEYPRNEQG